MLKFVDFSGCIFLQRVSEHSVGISFPLSLSLCLSGFSFKWLSLQYNAGLYLQSFAVELVVLAIWKKSLEICNSWLASITGDKSPGSTSGKESTISSTDETISQPMLEKIDFSDPSTVSSWVNKCFIFAVNHAEKLSRLIQNMDGRTALFSTSFLLVENFSVPCT